LQYYCWSHEIEKRTQIAPTGTLLSIKIKSCILHAFKLVDLDSFLFVWYLVALVYDIFCFMAHVFVCLLHCLDEDYTFFGPGKWTWDRKMSSKYLLMHR